MIQLSPSSTRPPSCRRSRSPSCIAPTAQVRHITLRITWPMTAATWILMYKKPQDPAAAAEALKFFAWSYEKGAKMAEELDYIAMPKNVVDSVKKTWASEVKDASGKPLYAMAR